jgi:hypothetical protein
MLTPRNAAREHVSRLVQKPRSEGGPPTAKGYSVAFVDVNDPEGYKAYIAENAIAFRKYGGRFLTRGGKALWVRLWRGGLDAAAAGIAAAPTRLLSCVV